MKTITSKHGTARQNIALNFKLALLLKELESNDSMESVCSKQIQFLKSNTFQDLISELDQFDVILRSKDEWASDMCSDEESLYEDALELPETNKRDEATQVEQLMIAHELGPKKPLHRLDVKHDDIRLLKIESQNPEEVLCSIVALHVLSDGRIVLLQQGNNLKLHSRTLPLISQLQLKHNVKDMCIIDQNRNGLFTVAVCFEQSCTITFIGHDVKFQERHTIHCSNNVVCISMYVHHLVALVETKGFKSSFEIQLLDKSTGHACYAFDKFKRMNDTHSLHGTNVVIDKPTRIYACKTKMKITLADANTVYIFKIEDGDCNHQTVCAVGQCVWKLSDIALSLNNVRDVKCDSQGHVYALTKSYLYQMPQPCINYNLRYLISNCRTAAAVAIDEYSQSIVLGQKNADRAHYTAIDFRQTNEVSAMFLTGKKLEQYRNVLLDTMGLLVYLGLRYHLYCTIVAEIKLNNGEYLLADGIAGVVQMNINRKTVFECLIIKQQYMYLNSVKIIKFGIRLTSSIESVCSNVIWKNMLKLYIH
ncbi:hypothetical protein DPMN_061909 [Dreissena polymorpha]|uniref:Uncharacterized protein n=1 Tax=Dreissena polymorpha TaxID=45954 RepID=A0A9D4C8A1_DREPO|nr:hypothetical protein DPMN_061909 [Dreissena polymorpha]